MIPGISNKVSAALREAYHGAHTRSVVGAVVGLSAVFYLASPLAAQQGALPDIGQMTYQAQDFVDGVGDEQAGRAKLLPGAEPVDARDQGAQWQRLNRLSIGEVRTLSRIVLRSNTELRSVQAHLRNQLQGAGETFQNADHTANMAVIIGTMAADADPFSISAMQARTLRSTFLDAVSQKRPAYREIVEIAMGHASTIGEMAAAGQAANFTPARGVTKGSSEQARDREAWYQADSMTGPEIRRLSDVVTQANPAMLAHRDALIADLRVAGLGGKEAQRLADVAIVTGAIAGEAGAYDLDQPIAGETRDRFVRQIRAAFGGEAISQLLIEGCERAERLAGASGPAPN